MQSVLDFAHALAADAVSAGDVAVDATVGNGHDTAFLAEQVGASGRVFGVDVQTEAIRQTRSRLDAAGCGEWVTLIPGSHDALAAHVPEAHHGAVSAVTFNLGYLPGADHDVITRPETTIPALDAAVALLRPGGVVTVVVYTGHDGGPRESDAVRAWAETRPQSDLQVLIYRFLNQRNAPPYLIAVEKRAET